MDRMLWRLLGVILIFCTAARSDAAEQAGRSLCLSPGATSAAVSAHEVVDPAEALAVARRAVPGSEVLRAALCREPDVLVYHFMVLKTDGRVVRVTIDAPSGKVIAVR